jgi:hypothetical protein
MVRKGDAGKGAQKKLPNARGLTEGATRACMGQDAVPLAAKTVTRLGAGTIKEQSRAIRARRAEVLLHGMEPAPCKVKGARKIRRKMKACEASPH